MMMTPSEFGVATVLMIPHFTQQPLHCYPWMNTVSLLFLLFRTF